MENTATNTLACSREYVYELYLRFQYLFAPAVNAAQVSWIRRIYPTSMYTHLTSRKMVSHIRARDTVDVLLVLRHTSRDDDAALLTSMYVIS